jgi:hypothetical protein
MSGMAGSTEASEPGPQTGAGGITGATKTESEAEEKKQTETSELKPQREPLKHHGDPARSPVRRYDSGPGDHY